MAHLWKAINILIVISSTSLQEFIARVQLQPIPCENGEVVTVHFGNSSICIQCPACQRGHEPSIPCGSSLTTKESEIPRIKCERCHKGTYSDRRSTSDCKPCTKCKRNEHTIRKCTRRSDTVCISCREGLYFSQEKLTCLPCWRCCGNDKDVRIDECMESPHHCSFESSKNCSYHIERNMTVDLKQSRMVNRSIYNLIHITPTSTRKNEMYSTRFKTNDIALMSIIVTVLLVVSLVVMVLFMIKWRRMKNYIKQTTGIYKRNTSKRESRCNDCFPVMSKNVKRFSDIYMSANDQSDDLDDFSKYDVFSCMYHFNSGVCIRHDRNSTIDGARNLVVEILDDASNSHFQNIESGYIFVSAIFRFYSQGTMFDKLVEISLPHSALIDTAVKNWDIKVLCMDEREEKKAKWKEIDGEVNVECSNIKFYSKTLLTYAVVGKPITSAKKRMQFALFSMQKMKSDRLEMMLYLLDESKYYLDRVIKENKRKGWEMIGCLYAVFVDCCNAVDIIINIEELLEPWSLVHLKDKVISSPLLHDSYFKIPTVHVMFRRAERRAQTFSCNFRVDIGGSEIIIPAVTFVPQEMLSVFVDVHNEDPSLFERKTLLNEVPYDIKYQMCRKLDIPARGKGQWRDVGRFFGVSEDKLQFCCNEYATLDGSPSRCLLEIICTQIPQLTVGKMNKCLEKLGRGDVVAVLDKIK